MPSCPACRPLPACLSALVAALLALMALAGCGTAPASRPVRIVIAASATANEPAPVLAASDLALLSHAGADSSDAVAYIIDPGTGQPTTIPLTPKRADGQVEYGPMRSTLLAQNIGQVQRVLGSEAATGPFDLLRLIAAAVRTTRPPATLIIVSSGLSAAGAFDLRELGWAANPAAVAAELSRQGQLPDLAGWQVVFSGLGDVAGIQPSIPLPQQATLVSYWMDICADAHASKCSTDDLTRPDPPSHSTTPVPIVPVPVVQAVHGPSGGSGVSVPDDTFFAFNSSRLLPGADSVLVPLAAKVRSLRLEISITGYASPDGGTASYNRALSQARVRSVATRLLALGVPARQIVHVAGLGTAGKTLRSCYRAGHFAASACAQLRRVVILLTPPNAALATNRSGALR